MHALIENNVITAIRDAPHGRLMHGVRRILDNAADTAVFRPAYDAGFLVGYLVGGVALILLGRKWSRP